MVDPATGEISSAPLPSIRMFQIALKEWREEYKNEILRITDPDGYRNKVEFTATNSQTATRLNEVWQIDASPADVMLNGKRRHSIYMAVDVYSRRAIVLATPTPRAEGVGLLIRRCILAWGVPERIKTDNGSDFVARQIKRLFAALGDRGRVVATVSTEVKRDRGENYRDIPARSGNLSGLHRPLSSRSQGD